MRIFPKFLNPAVLKEVIGLYKFLDRPVQLWLLATPVLGILSTGVEFIFARFIQEFVSKLNGAPSASTAAYSMIALASVLISLGFVRSFLQFSSAQSATLILEGANARFRNQVLRGVLNHSRKTHIPASNTYFLLSEIFPKGTQALFYIAQAIPQILVAICLSVVLVYYSPYLGIISLVGIFFTGIVMLRINRYTSLSAREVPKEQRLLLAGIERVTRNWLLVRVLRTHTKEIEQLSKNISKYAEHSISACKSSNFAAAIPQVLGATIVGAISIAAIDYKMIDQALVLSFMYLFFRLTQTLSVLGNYGGTILLLFPQFSAMCKFALEVDAGDSLDLEVSENRNKRIALNSSGIASNNPPEIIAENLSFQYPNGTVALRNFSNIFNAGEQTGIVGRSGSGKSTLLNLLLGVFEPTDGQIRIDNSAATDFCAKMPHRIGYVGADSFLVEGNIKENLDYGLEIRVSMLDYKEALRNAGISKIGDAVNSEEILRLPMHADGSSLSAGQKQRICLARAFLRKPDLLILDEATANLDYETEQSILTSLQDLKGKATVIIVSHKSETLKYCDSVITLSEL
ncbi:MAG: ABC transporter ATP-binding protein [Flavobacterium sp.]|nr:MAG: ABC transporter ATP-binding protein [Flavobacterium sp.]